MCTFSGVQLIPSKIALDFLSNAAPRPWVRRMLQWMIFSDQLAPYFTAGEIKSMVRVYEMFYSKEGFDHDFTTEQRKQWIEENFEPEIAAKLVTHDRMDLIEEYRVVWTINDEPRKMGAGYLVYSQDIDWDAGTVSVELSQPLGSLEEHLFWDAEEHLSSEYEAAHFEVSLSGLCFEQEAIEMLLPSHSLDNYGAMLVNAIDRPSTKPALGRPPKWDWEGAISYLVSVAQHPDGLPQGEGAQARIEEMISQWFIDQCGDSPSTSQIRQRARSIILAIKKG